MGKTVTAKSSRAYLQLLPHFLVRCQCASCCVSRSLPCFRPLFFLFQVPYVLTMADPAPNARNLTDYFEQRATEEAAGTWNQQSRPFNSGYGSQSQPKVWTPLAQDKPHIEGAVESYERYATSGNVVGRTNSKLNTTGSHPWINMGGRSSTATTTKKIVIPPPEAYGGEGLHKGVATKMIN